MIRSLFLSTCGVHHANAGMPSMPLATAYSATSTGYDSLRSANRSQDVVPSFHCTQRCHPRVVFLRCLLCPFRAYRSWCSTSVRSVLCATSSSSIGLASPLGSTCAIMFCAIILAVYAVTVPSGNSTSYDLVSRMGLSLACP